MDLTGFTAYFLETVIFQADNKEYTLHYDTSSNNAHAQTVCEDSYQSNLAMITSQSQLTMLNENFERLAVSWYHEAWVGGRTSVTNNHLVTLDSVANTPTVAGKDLLSWYHEAWVGGRMSMTNNHLVT